MKPALLGCLFALHLWAAPAYIRTITIQASQCGSASSSNFPVLVLLSGQQFKSAANGGHVHNSNGYDVLFWSNAAATSALTWEIDYYDPVGGNFWGWVLIPTVSNTVNTVFYVTYGDPTITTFQSTATSVWTNAFDYVWHGGGGGTLTLTDSTSNGNTATNSANPVTATTAQIAGGGAFVAASSEALTIDSDPAALQPSSITYSLWYNSSSDAGTAFRKNAGWRINSKTASNNVQVIDSGGNTILAGYPVNIEDGNWHYIVVTFNALTSVTNALNLYVDNNAVVSANAMSTGGIKYSSGASAIGSGAFAGSFFNGSLDEARVATGARAASWITTEYNNQSNPTSFAQPGNEMVAHGLLLVLGMGN